jgi:hypothetical protein
MLSFIGKTGKWFWQILRELKWQVKVLLVLALGALVVMPAMIVYTGTPSFCNSCHVMNDYYDNWASSSHKEVNCLMCHLKPGLEGYIEGKINGLAQAIDCAVGRFDTKAHATVVDASCLREGCHSVEELKSDDIQYSSTKFAHEKHLFQTVDGIKIACTTCHSHFVGNEHFEVHRDVCFSCHFLKSSLTGKRLVQTTCVDCHKVPDTKIKMGLVTVDHADFIAYKANCDDSCHKKQILQENTVARTVCWNCHSFGNDQGHSSTELHQAHTADRKVECFSCHGNVFHGPLKPESVVAAMMDCQNCHGNTHNVQQTVYTANTHPDTGNRILGPMFLSHVDCTGCHGASGAAESSGALDSLGIVSRASAAACDKCHEPGTGDKYVPFWQKTIRELYAKVDGKWQSLKDYPAALSDRGAAEKLETLMAEARALLDSVQADGSWGVHNFKYTETLLTTADNLISQVK